MQLNELKNTTSVLALLRNRFATVGVALVTGVASMTPAFATIDNTVTVTGSSPGGTDDVTDTATENVDVQDAAPVLTVTKVASDTTDVAAGDTITYTYTVTNDGNVGVTNVSLSDNHNIDADGTLGTITLGSLTDNAPASDSTDDTADNDWDYLAPGDTVSWTATYTVTINDIANESADGDGTLDNTVTASAGYTNSGGSADTVTGTASESVDLENPNPSLAVTKVADDTTDVTLGQVITYTYTVTNDGNVPITAISLADVHNGSGTAPAPDADGATLTDNGTTGDSPNSTTGDGEWDTLAPGDVITMTATYTVTQSDIDNLQ